MGSCGPLTCAAEWLAKELSSRRGEAQRGSLDGGSGRWRPPFPALISRSRDARRSVTEIRSLAGGVAVWDFKASSLVCLLFSSDSMKEISVWREDSSLLSFTDISSCILRIFCHSINIRAVHFQHKERFTKDTDLILEMNMVHVVIM